MRCPYDPMQPCPFCGCSGDPVHLGGGIKVQIQCNSCGATGPAVWDIGNAIKLWNIRYQPKQFTSKG